MDKIRVKKMHDAVRKHGMSGTPIYHVWAVMKDRCCNSNNPRYADYGGRGITYCDRWENFENFYADMGDRPEDGTLDRIDVDGPYSPENCRWISNEDQQNNRRNNRHLTVGNETLTISQWAKKVGVARNTIDGRLAWGWSPEEAIGPVQRR